MDNNRINDISDPYFEEIKSKTSLSFDFVLWFYRILKYWYLFIISLAICISIAYIQNRKWIPVYGVKAMLMLENRGNASIVSGSVPLGSILQNTVNQQILLQSYGMTDMTVKSLPAKMHIDYFRKTTFKRFSLYDVTPIDIEVIEIQPNAYNYTFNVEYIDANSCRIYYEENEETNLPAFSLNVPFDKEIVDPEGRFKIKLLKTGNFGQFAPFSFNFLSDNQLINMYLNRITSGMEEFNGEASSILSLSMYGPDPSRDIEYLKTLLEVFHNYNLTLKNEQADLTINFIENQLKIINDSLVAARVTLDKFQKETGVYEITSPALRQDIDQADGKKDNLYIKEKAILVITEKINESIFGNTELIEPFSLGVQEPKLQELVAAYNGIVKKAKYLGPKNPLYLKTIEEINDNRTSILRELQLLQLDIQEEKDKLIENLQLLELKVDNLPPQERELVRFQRDYRVNETYHQFLTQKKYEAQIQKASNTPDNYVWEKPRLATGPINGDETKRNYMFFAFIGFIIPLGIIVLKEEVLNNTIATKEECEKLSGLPVIGTIENISKKLSAGVVLVKNYPKSSFAESFRNMRIRIEYMAKRENNVVVLITSAEPGDGKTFIATNIASVYQLAGKKVVIVDLDLRRPSVSKTLQLDSQKGVSNYLIGQVELEDVIISHPDYGFDIIPAGTLPPNPSELIKTDKTKELIKHLKETYDYVVIDCSPVGLVSDAYLLAKEVDTTLFVVRRAKTNRAFFKSVINQLRSDGVANTSLIFNDVKGREGYYGTSRYYGDRTYYLKKNSYYHDDYFEN